MPEPALPPARYERTDISLRAVLIAFPLILLALLGAVILARLIYPQAAVDRRLPSRLPDYPGPRLQTDPQADMARFLKTEQARLNGAGWDDTAKTRGHIPIDDAMRRLAASGIPDWPK
jgi:hypothetical protein